MINNTFSFPRFWNYFKYDLKQMWRNNGRAVILLGFLSLVVYLLWIVGSLIFTQRWQAPSLAARSVVFYIGALILVLYNTRTYGYLTERKAGSSWLMIPASTLEKFVSMMIVTIVVLPLAYVASYLLLDGIITLIDRSAGEAILVGVGPLLQRISDGMTEAGAEGLHIHAGMLVFPVILQFISNLLYFLLCGISFKKWKLVGAFAILIGVETLLSTIVSILAFNGVGTWSADFDADPQYAVNLFNTVLSFATTFNALLVLGLGGGIFWRLKTLKH